MPTRIARGTGGLVSMMRGSPAVGQPLRGFAEGIDFASPRRNGAAAFMDRSGLNDKSAPFQGKAKGFVGRGLLGVNPNHHPPGGNQELPQPIKRDLESFERAPPPIDQHCVVLAGRMAAVCRSCRASIAAAMQLKHHLDALETTQ